MGDNLPKMELYKLLLYEEGSQYVFSVFVFQGCSNVWFFTPARISLFVLLMSMYIKQYFFSGTQKKNGMFATVIIVLPSAYTGGQVVLSHASTTRTIDFSEDSHGIPM